MKSEKKKLKKKKKKKNYQHRKAYLVWCCCTNDEHRWIRLAILHKKEKSVCFAAGNIAFLEITPDGQNTLHGTILVINQNDVTDDDTDYIPVNEPIYVIYPTNLTSPVIVEESAYNSNEHFSQQYKPNNG